jgi:hypothetical protein
MEAAIRAARRELGLSEEEDEDETEGEAIGWGKTGVPDSRRGADQSRVKKLKCTRYGKSSKVRPPKRTEFVQDYGKRNAKLEDEADDMSKVKWFCSWCGRANHVKVQHGQARQVSRRANESAARAIASFREAYTAAPKTAHPAASAVEAFHTVNQDALDRDLWQRCQQQQG